MDHAMDLRTRIAMAAFVALTALLALFTYLSFDRAQIAPALQPIFGQTSN